MSGSAACCALQQRQQLSEIRLLLLLLLAVLHAACAMLLLPRLRHVRLRLMMAVWMLMVPMLLVVHMMAAAPLLLGPWLWPPVRTAAPHAEMAMRGCTRRPGSSRRLIPGPRCRRCSMPIAPTLCRS